MSRLLTRQLRVVYRLRVPARTYSSFKTQPSPPKLAPEQQAEFERLQRSAAVSSAFNPPVEGSEGSSEVKAEEVEDEDVNQGMFRGAKPEFKGDTNPKTGEVGGPKNEPLRSGASGEWSYNGRATDF